MVPPSADHSTSVDGVPAPTVTVATSVVIPPVTATVSATWTRAIAETATHVPAEHTRLVPHAVPSTRFPMALQVGALDGVEHAVAPSLQGSAGVQLSFARQAATHDPFAQTRASPHAVPSTLLPLAMQDTGAVADAHCVTPTLQPSAGWHVSPATHAVSQRPLLHRRPPPQSEPSSRLPTVVHVGSDHSCAHANVPIVQALPVSHDRPASHRSRHAPAEHTPPFPHGVPSTLWPVTWHAGVEMGDSHAVAPVAHAASGWQMRFAVQVRHTPPEQTPPVPHAVPSGFVPVAVHVPGCAGDVHAS
jgi:hypothetical protein